MGTITGKHTVGEAIVYGSIYGYQKNKYPVIRSATGEVIGHVKEELILNGEKQVVAKAYYTRNIHRPYGEKRFYESVEALILAFGGTIDRTKKKSVDKPCAAKAAHAKKTRHGKPASRVKK